MKTEKKQGRGKDLLIAKTKDFSDEELDFIYDEIERESAGYTTKKHYIELYRQTMQVLFAFQEMHGYLCNITEFASMLSDIATDLKIDYKFSMLVYNKYYLARVNEIQEKTRKENAQRHIEDAKMTYLEDKYERESNNPENMYL